MAILLIKPLNALLLGTRYAENLGINIRRTRNLLLVATGLLTAVTTAFCGPIAFIGLAVPHMTNFSIGCIGLLIMFMGFGQVVIYYTQESKREQPFDSTKNNTKRQNNQIHNNNIEANNQERTEKEGDTEQ